MGRRDHEIRFDNVPEVSTRMGSAAGVIQGEEESEMCLLGFRIVSVPPKYVGRLSTDEKYPSTQK